MKPNLATWQKFSSSKSIKNIISKSKKESLWHFVNPLRMSRIIRMTPNYIHSSKMTPPPKNRFSFNSPQILKTNTEYPFADPPSSEICLSLWWNPKDDLFWWSMAIQWIFVLFFRTLHLEHLLKVIVIIG